MKSPKKPRPIVFVKEGKGSTVWISAFTRPMNGEPEIIEFRGFAREGDALAFKLGRQQSMRDVTCMCLTRERPKGIPESKGRRS
jgi:hypothetical protein